MPANLTPQYLEAEEKYKAAIGNEEKLRALIEMLRMIPKHKGTEKLQADIKRKISSYKKLTEKKEKKVHHFAVEKNGMYQIVAIGAPNVGKSKLLSVLANAELKVEPYPFTTRVATPVVVEYEDVRLQLVDTPPITNSYMENWLPGVIRSADAILWIIDFSDNDVLENTQAIVKRLESQKIFLKYKNQNVSNVCVKNTTVVASKSDLAEVGENIEIIKELIDEDLNPCLVSVDEKNSLEKLTEKLFFSLDIIRVYAKPPGKKPDMENPILLPKNSNVIDLATKIHQDLAKEVKSARIWNSAKFTDGQNIPRDSVLFDKNIVELTK